MDLALLEGVVALKGRRFLQAFLIDGNRVMYCTVQLSLVCVCCLFYYLLRHDVDQVWKICRGERKDERDRFAAWASVLYFYSVGGYFLTRTSV